MDRFTHSSKQLTEELGFSLSTLRRYKQARLLLPGRHYLMIGIGKIKPRSWWDPIEVSKTLEFQSRRSTIK